jgi:hypothetical protein
VSPGSIGGASDDAGVEYRRAVAAYAAVCGLARMPLIGLELPTTAAQVSSVVLETDAAVDDISIDFSTGWSASVQAKRTLRRGKPLDKALEQWVRAGLAGVDPDRQRLVIVTGALNGPMRAFRDLLNRQRLTRPGRATAAEQQILDHVNARLADLNDSQRERVLRAAVIWELQVEDPRDSGAREAVSLLHTIGGPDAAEASQAWSTLIAVAGKLARRRAGHDLAGWLGELRGAGLVLQNRGGPRTALELRQQALRRYLDRLVREGRELDLRGLGAELPPLRWEQADASVLVDAESAWSEFDEKGWALGADLLWAFLRRGRVVLTGLPGAGKSTAVRRTAGRLAGFAMASSAAAASAWPLPLVASLRDVNGRRDGTSFRDRLIATAVAQQPLADRAALRRLIEERFDHGEPVALFLDALDETYEDRDLVVREIDRLVGDLSDNVSILIASRDVAHGQASTLGWADVRMRPPTNVHLLIRAALAASAEHQGVTIDARDDWTEVRHAWVSRALKRDEALCQTPLVPLLLTLLAIRRSPEQIPTKRAEILRAVVTDFVARHELRRQDGRTLGPLGGQSLETAAMQAFGREAAALLDNSGVVSEETVRLAIASMFVGEWQIASGHAEVAARAAIRLFDETGIFVRSESNASVTARLSQFAEIGDVLHAIRRADSVREWVARRVAGRQLEPILLGAALDDEIARELQRAVAASPDDLDLVRAVARSHHEGVTLEKDTLNSVGVALIESISTGTQRAWEDWSRLLGVGIPANARDDAIAAAAVHSPTHELMARAAVMLQDMGTNAILAEPGVLLEVLRLEHLPQSPPHGDHYHVSDDLPSLQLRSARILVEGGPEAVAAVRDCALNDLGRRRNAFADLLESAGYPDIGAEVRAERAAIEQRTPSSLIPFDEEDRDTGIFAILAELAPAASTRPDNTRFDEVADFFATLRLSDETSDLLHGQPDEFLRAVTDLIVALLGFDRALLGAEARALVDRMSIDASYRPYMAMFDGAALRMSPDWSAVEDHPAAIDLLVELFKLSMPLATLAMGCLRRALAGAARHVVPKLRLVVADRGLSAERQRLAAQVLAKISPGPEPESWVQSLDPVLRTVAAECIEPLANAHISCDLRRLLKDDDGNVREGALANLYRVDAPDLVPLLEELGNEMVGWMCARCREINPVGHQACLECSEAGPDPSETAREMLAERLESNPA